jgi:hypothetical protein
MAVEELPRPDGTAGAKDADEIVRGWLIDGKLQLSIRADTFDDPGEWGIFLSDLAKEIAKAKANAEGSSENAGDYLSQIIEMMNVMTLPGEEEPAGSFEPPLPPL